ncbi:YDG domain-containing protein [Ferruginibacter albus]|uniref:YDG domain-containing protein n=1 Tax=Ferruginibacter albus TaxID=2875540 RepID=UPI001CC4A62C|nr:YDG domain-containing protein [Ferruginibacter albus]UAY51311.1 T9SS type A sorting domain-containing protein [Ferruginibacter albus]
MKQLSLSRFNGVLKFLFVVITFTSVQKTYATATTLAPGDIALLGINADNPDKFSVILLKDIGSGTVINFTDNGFTSATAGRSNENYLIYTAPSDLKAGTILSWTNGMSVSGTGWNSGAPSNFSFNASGDQLFIFQGTADDSHWTSQSGITLLYGINYGAALITKSSDATASTTFQPSTTLLPSTYFLNFPSSSANDLYYAAGSSSSTKVSFFGSLSGLATELTTTSKFFATNSALTLPVYIFAVGTLTAVNTTYGTASATPTSFQVTGTGLSGSISIAASTGFEYSTTSGGTYSSTLTLSQASGIVNTSVFVRLAATTDVGTYSGNIGLSSSGAQSFNVVPVSSTVSAKSLSITAPAIAQKTYDGTTTAGTVTAGTLSNLVGTQTVGVSATAAAYSSANAGTYNNVVITYTLSNGTNGGKASNYSLAAGSATGVIKARDLSITAPAIAQKPYDGTTTAGAVTAGTLSNLVGTQTVGVSATAAAYSSANAGTYNNVVITYTLSNGTNGGNASNYNLVNGTATGVIGARSLTITAKNITKNYGDALSDGTSSTAFTSNNLVSPETIGSVTVAYGSGAAATAAPGIYNNSITVSAATGGTFTASNYNIAYAQGNITVSIASTQWKTSNATTDWSSAGNWTNGLPTQYMLADIPVNASPYPELTQNTSVYNLSLGGASTLTLGANTLTVNNNITGTGTLKGSSLSGLLLANDHVNPSLNFASGADTLYNLTLNDNATATLGSTLNLAARTNATPAKLTVGNSAVFNTQDGLTLISNNCNTAMIAPVLGAITGKVTVQRYLRSDENSFYATGNPTTGSAKRAWRLMTAPVQNNGSPTIYESWQEGGLIYSDNDASTHGKGTMITGPNASNGLESGVNGSYSMKFFNAATQKLENVANTNVAISQSANNGSAENTGYFIFVRGDRNPQTVNNPNSGTAPVDNTTLSVKGNLQTGKQEFSIVPSADFTSQKYTLIGNPYAAPVDLNKLTFQGYGAGNIDVYTWDPSIGQVGAYVLLENSGSGFQTNATTGQNNFIQSSQAFFVLGTTNQCSVIFNESSKAGAQNNNLVFRPTGAPTNPYMIARLYKVNNDNSVSVLDYNQTYFNDAYSIDPVLGEDAPKLANINETFSVMRDSVALFSDRRPRLRNLDTVFFKLLRTNEQKYQIRFVDSLPDVNADAYLIDKYTGDSTKVSLTDSSTIVNFTVNSDSASKSPTRFVLFLRPQTTTPVRFTNVNAQPVIDNAIKVQWNVEEQSGIKYYEVERSNDNKTFTTVATIAVQTSSGALQYSWIDNAAGAGNNYYRIKTVENSGTEAYSKIAMASINALNAEISIYPNPVKNGLLNISLKNISAGNYTIALRNAIGQEILRTIISHDGTNQVKNLQVNKKIAKGMYQLTVEGLKNSINTINVVVE